MDEKVNVLVDDAAVRFEMFKHGKLPPSAA